ncbi:MAG TPA: efflux RND transporter periplasmic adaptor subunit [Chloroflexota bacterium]|nr:efflux RND transporter periplasmic adaptor subunit [Chloroflexota bacterium]
MPLIRGFSWLAGGLAATLLAGCAGQPAAAPPRYQSVKVTRENVEATVSASGAIALSQLANVSPEAGSTSSSAKIKTVDVTVGQHVAAGQQLAQLQTTDLANQLQQAQINLSLAQSKLDALEHPDTTSLENQAQQAQVNLASAQTKLLATEHPYTAADLASAQNAVNGDQLSLKAAQQSLDAARVSPQATSAISAQQDQVIYWTNNYIQSKQAFDKGNETQDKLNSDYRSMTDAQAALQAAKDQADSAMTAAQQGVNSAQAALAKDQANLALIQAGPKATDLQLAQQQVQLAQQAAAAAQHALASAVSPNDVKQAQGAVDLATAAAALAQHQLDAATLRAPFAGTVIAVGASPGDSVTSATTVATVADLSQAEVDINVNQLDVGKLALDQPAHVTVPSFPTRKFSGKVSKIASSATNSQGVITYAVTVNLDSTGNVLKAGMSATADIVVSTANNVLVVPSAAIQSTGGRSYVLIPPDMHHQTVRTGISSGNVTAVTTGLSDGQVVAIVLATASTSSRPSNGFRGPGPGAQAVKFVGPGPGPRG